MARSVPDVTPKFISEAPTLAKRYLASRTHECQLIVLVNGLADCTTRLRTNRSTSAMIAKVTSYTIWQAELPAAPMKLDALAGPPADMK